MEVGPVDVLVVAFPGIYDRNGPELREASVETGGLFDPEDVDDVAADLEPGNSVGLVCWENAWAAPFVTELAASGAMVMDQRIPRDAVLAAPSTASLS